MIPARLGIDSGRPPEFAHHDQQRIVQHSPLGKIENQGRKATIQKAT